MKNQLLLLFSLSLAFATSFSMHGMESLASSPKMIGGIPATHIEQSAKSYIKKVAPNVQFASKSQSKLAPDLMQPDLNAGLMHTIKNIMPYIMPNFSAYKELSTSKKTQLNADLMQILNDNMYLGPNEILPGSLDQINNLISQGASVNHIETQDRQTPLILACMANQPRIMELLLNLGAHDSINIPNSRGVTPLLMATGDGRSIGNIKEDIERHVQIVKLLLAFGAQKSINQPSNNNYTPLHGAAHSGYVPLVELLLAHGAQASVNAVDREGGDTPLSLLLTPSHRKGRTTGKHFQKIAAMLLNNGASATINVPSSGYTPLLRAIGRKGFDMTKLLLQHNAHLSINQKNGSGYTPLEAADVYKDLKTYCLLFYYGANPTTQKLRNMQKDAKWAHSIFFKNSEKKRSEALKQTISPFVPIVPLINIIYEYLQPFSFEQVVLAHQEAANNRVRAIQERLAAQASSTPSNAPTTVTLQAASTDTITRNPLDTAEEKHDENGEVVPAPHGTESLDS